MNSVSFSQLQAAKASMPLSQVNRVSNVVSFGNEDNKDKVDFSKTETTAQPPKIGRARLFWGNLTDEQIKGINESGKLPENAKFVMNGFGGYTICNNFFGFRAGTRDLPVGFEVKKNCFGLAVVLPKGTQGACIKK